jgi:hypothetical protein
MKKITAAVVGFVVAPILPAVVSALGTPAMRDRGMTSILRGTVFFYYFAAAFTILFGIPTFCLCGSAS